jgi:protein involved in polysaccharide export with SLBB domain
MSHPDFSPFAPGSARHRPASPRAPWLAVRVAGAALAVCLSLAAPASAQVSPQQAAELLKKNAALVRQRIQESGLSAEEIRARLTAAGYPATLLDPYLAAAAPGAQPGAEPEVNEQMLKALDVLAPSPRPQGLQAVPVETGAQPPSAAAPAAPAAEPQLFGADVFRGRTTQFQPLLTGPVPPNYRVGPGDVMVLVITGDVEFVHELAVTREGFIVIPQVGQLYVNNLTLNELRALLARRLGQSYSGIRAGTTKFDVTIARLRTNQVFVIGEAVQPGAYQLSSVATALNALYAAGGPSDRGSFRDIEVRRLGEVIARLDLYDYLLHGDTKNDVVLEQGDVIFVPVHGTRATVQGAVKRPAIYELKGRETLRDLIAAAGGFRADAALRRISISRIVPPGQRSDQGPDRVVVDVPLAQVQDGFAPPVPIEPGDVVTVFAVPEGRRSVVELKGAVYHPGTYGFRPGMRLSELIRLGGGFRPAVYAGQATIERLNLADSTRYIVRVPLPADSAQPYPDDAPLQDYDIVNVYGREELREERTVSIAGMVNQPGTFPYRSGMTLRDLVLMARGLKDGAYLDTAEVARLAEDRSGGRLAVTLRVPLDSSYLFEPDSSTYPLLKGLPAPPRGTAPEVMLEPFDHVLILKQPDFEYPRKVAIAGEVKFPGTYVLAAKDERLSTLLAQAGGLTPWAFPEGFRLYRGGRLVNVDLPAVLRNPDHRDNVILQPGDSMVVPEYNPVVVVEGAVNSPSAVLYRRGAPLDYYIANAGGYARNADKGRVHVRYANGAARVKSKFLFFTAFTPEPGPGSVITVPVKPEGEPFKPTEFFGAVAQILASTVAILVLATRL